MSLEKDRSFTFRFSFVTFFWQNERNHSWVPGIISSLPSEAILEEVSHSSRIDEPYYRSVFSLLVGTKYMTVAKLHLKTLDLLVKSFRLTSTRIGRRLREREKKDFFFGSRQYSLSNLSSKKKKLGSPLKRPSIIERGDNRFVFCHRAHAFTVCVSRPTDDCTRASFRPGVKT